MGIRTAPVAAPI